MSSRGRANTSSSDNVEFTVKAAEDLTLSGTERSIVRVPANFLYACMMMKNQKFSSLFRHYSKHHGLPRHSLVFYFTKDVILVRMRSQGQEHKGMQEREKSKTEFFAAMTDLYERGEHADVTFRVGPQGSTTRSEFRAHRAILSARSEYFRAMFSKAGGGMRESVGEVELVDRRPQTVSRLLEYIYTDEVRDLESCPVDELVDLIIISEEFLLPRLKTLCEDSAGSAITSDSVGRLLSAAERFNAERLKELCLDFILQNLPNISESPEFTKEVEAYPQVALSVLRAAAHVIPSAKKRKREGDEGRGEREGERARFEPMAL